MFQKAIFQKAVFQKAMSEESGAERLSGESGGSGESGDRPLPLGALTDPRFLVALVVLVVNDHWLKAAYGTWLTGKLSDLAGLIVLPVVIGVAATAICGRPASHTIGGRRLASAALAGTGLWFTAMKTMPSVAAATERVFETLTGRPSTIVVDPSDLLGLVGLVIAWTILCTPRPLLAGRTVRAILLGAGLVASVASGYDGPSFHNLLVDPSSGEVVVSYADTDPPADLRSLPDQEPLSALAAERFVDVDQLEDCMTGGADGDGLCFRIADGRVQQRSTAAGQWETVWRLEPARPAFNDYLVYSAAGHQASLALEELAVSNDNRVYVVVDELGSLVVREPDGLWEPPAERFRSAATLLSLVAALAVLVVLPLVGPTRVARWGIIVGLVGAAISFATHWHQLGWLTISTAIWLGLPVLFFGLVFAVIYVVRWVDWRRWPILIGLMLVGAAAPTLPLQIWRRNLDMDYDIAYAASLTLAVAAVGLAALAGPRLVVAPEYVRAIPEPPPPTGYGFGEFPPEPPQD